MAIHQIRCLSCKKLFEFMKIRSNDKVEECPHCGERDVIKLVKEFPTEGAPNFVLKGKGWFKDGYE